MAESSPRHSAEAAISGFAEKLGSRARHVAVLLGAGASCAANLPSTADLKSLVGDALGPPHADQFSTLSKNRDLEQTLTHVRLVAELLSGSEGSVTDLTEEQARELDREICRAIATVITESDAVAEYHLSFARWVGAMNLVRPLEIFTTNYDLLVEKGLEEAGVPYFDGFVGTYKGRFRADLVDEDIADKAARVPPGWARVWKLHGSITWTISSDGTDSSVLRIGRESTADASTPLAIFPSLQKYDESRRQPFVVLSDRLRRSLGIPETVVITSGYSFGDQHINELLYDAARYYPRSEIMALFRDEIPPGLLAKAQNLPNLTVMGAKDAVIGGEHRKWEFDTDHQLVVDGKMKIGDFRELTGFLSRKIGRVEPPTDSTEANDGP